MLIYKFAKLIIKINSKIQQSKTYNKIINNFIHKNKNCNAINIFY